MQPKIEDNSFALPLRMLIWGGLGPAPQHLGHGPGLGYAAVRDVGRLGVEDLA